MKHSESDEVPTTRESNEYERRATMLEILLMEEAGFELRHPSPQRTAEDLRKIEEALTPRTRANVVGYDVANFQRSAHAFGGDLVDLTELEDHRVAIVLADVVGKGLAAFVLKTALLGAIRAALFGDASPRNCMRLANRVLSGLSDSSKFFTAFQALLDPDSNYLTYSNAGQHPYPQLFSGDEEPLPLRTGGMVLGVNPDSSFEQGTLALESDDLLVIASDGITDALDARDHPFGVHRLAEVVREHRGEPAQTLVDAVFGAVDAHALGVPQTDDMSLVVIRRLPSC